MPDAFAPTPGLGSPSSRGTSVVSIYLYRLARWCFRRALARGVALIMAAVFASFMLGPDPIIKSIGFSFALGVLIDAFVVRLTLVPAVMAIVGAPGAETRRPPRRPASDVGAENYR